MASVLAKTPKRVIIRAHEHWHDEHQQITQDWFHFAGYCCSDETYDWTTDHYVHLGGVNGRRFHLIIDIWKNDLCTPSQLDDVTLEVYHLRKPVGKDSEFQYIDPELQRETYSLARQLTKALHGVMAKSFKEFFQVLKGRSQGVCGRA